MPGRIIQYLFDEENRLSCANKGLQVPSPSCNAQGNTSFIYDHAGVRKIKVASSPTIYPNQYYTDFGGGTAGSQFKHIFIGSQRILTKKSRIAPDRQHWYYHPDHLGSTAMVTNENGQLVDALHYFPFGEVWLEERPASLPADYFFTAKEFDPETGFSDFGARYLDPRFSKWMTADPALGDYLPGAGKAVAYQSPSLGNNWRSYPDLPGMGGAFQPTNLAPYGYGHQNPATLADPDGKCVEDLCIGEAILVTGLLISAYDAYKAYREEGARGAAKSVGTDVAITVVTGGAGKLVGKAVKTGYNFYREAKTARQLERAAKEAADLAQEMRPRPGAAGALDTGEEIFTAVSRRGEPPQLHRRVQNALDEVPVERRSPFHGRCVEPQCLSQALEKGIDPKGGTFDIRKVRSPGNPAHGERMEPCSTCEYINEVFGTKTPR